MNNSTKTILIWVGVIGITIGAIAGLYYLSANDPGNSTSSGNTLAEPVSARDHKLGPDNAKATLVEYGDYECPACASYEPWVEQLSVDFKDSLLIVFRQFPLSQHQNAQLAAEAAEAAGKQNKFWEMHKLLYANQKNWEKLSNGDALKTFEGYARGLGVDINKWKSDLTSPDVLSKIAADTSSGNRSGLQGTPTFFLNGKDIGYPQSYDDFKSLISKAL